MKKHAVVVGLGSIGRRHARLLAARPDLRVSWGEISEDMIQLARSELAAPHHLFRDFESVLDARPDYLILATPQSEHCWQACAALQAGIPVLCEKPLSDNLPDALRMVETVEQTGGCLVVGFQSHFSDGHCRMRELVQSGALGQIRHFHCRVGTYITLQNSRSRYQNKMFGALIQDYSHQLDLGLWMLRQAPTEVMAHGLCTKVPDLWADPNVLSVHFSYPAGLLGTLHLNYLQMPQVQSYEIVGDEGWLQFDADTFELKIGSRSTGTIARESHPVERDLVYQREHEAFFAAAANRAPGESPARDAALSVALADAVIASLISGCPVPVEGLPDSRNLPSASCKSVSSG